MANAEEKKRAPELEEFLRNLAQDFWGRDPDQCIDQEICVACGGPAKEFRDELSAKEFKISALCQDCQDKTFDEED